MARRRIRCSRRPGGPTPWIPDVARGNAERLQDVDRPNPSPGKNRNVKIPIWLIAALLSICSASAGQLLLKVGVRGAHLPPNPLQQPLSLVLALFQPLIICGIIAEATSMMLWLAAINTRALSAVYPMAALGYVIVTVVSVVFFGEGLSIGKIAGIALIVLGVVVLNSGFGPLHTAVSHVTTQAE